MKGKRKLLVLKWPTYIIIFALYYTVIDMCRTVYSSVFSYGRAMIVIKRPKGICIIISANIMDTP